jgi:hypothetical protein
MATAGVEQYMTGTLLLTDVFPLIFHRNNITYKWLQIFSFQLEYFVVD